MSQVRHAAAADSRKDDSTDSGHSTPAQKATHGLRLPYELLTGLYRILQPCITRVVNRRAEPFRFLDLPSEVRTLIYRHTTKSIWASSRRFESRQYIDASQYPTLALRLVSRQVKDEYDLEMFHSTNLIVACDGSYDADTLPVIRHLAWIARQRTRHLTIRIHVGYSPTFLQGWQVALNVARRELLKVEREFPSLKVLTVRFEDPVLHLDRCIKSGAFHLPQLFDMTLDSEILITRPTPLEFRKELLLLNSSYSVYVRPDGARNSIWRSRMPWLKGVVEKLLHQEGIQYLATPSRTSGWNGLDLTTHFAFDEWYWWPWYWRPWYWSHCFWRFWYSRPFPWHNLCWVIADVAMAIGIGVWAACYKRA